MRVQPAIRDVMERLPAAAIRLGGLIGRRHELQRQNRLLPQEEDHLLFPFRELCPVGFEHPDRPRQEIRGDWQGEYIGTWLEAACATIANAGDEELRAKVQAMVGEWLTTQHEDGYFGTYFEADRWKSWDLWVHAHDLIGLLAFFWLSGDERALAAATRAADCVLRYFGPGKRWVHETGYFKGMSSSSILEPMVWLYWETGDGRYLDWCRWLVEEDWEHPDGIRLLSTLLGGGSVAAIGGGKGIEMLICFAGLVDLYRACGDERYLRATLLAWDDIVRHQLYITGTASTGEFFTEDRVLRNDGVYRIGETCVSMGWIYLNLSLGRLTGEARFFDLAEQTLYNHLLAAQSPDGKGWAYYVGLRDSKRYRWHVDPECCPTRGVRALAQIPRHALTLDMDGVVINFYDAAGAELELASGLRVKLDLEGDYPFRGEVRLRLAPERPASFAVRLRPPGWCRDWALRVNGAEHPATADGRGYLVVERVWREGDLLELEMAMPVRVAVDALGNPGRGALVRGPLVYAADSAFLPPRELLDDAVLLLDREDPARGVEVLEDSEARSVHLVASRAVLETRRGEALWREPERYYELAGDATPPREQPLRMVPFFEAGNRALKIYQDGIWPNSEPVREITYQVWLPYRLRGGRETMTRA